jgi:hypothetical protein
MEVNGQLHDPAALLPGKEPLVPIVVGWVGPRTSLDTVAKRKIPSPCQDSNPPIIQPVAQHYITKLSQLLQFK